MKLIFLLPSVLASYIPGSGAPYHPPCDPETDEHACENPPKRKYNGKNVEMSDFPCASPIGSVFILLS